MKIKLQIAMDILSRQELVLLLKKINSYVDIVELGTPYLLTYGTDVIRDIKNIAPKVEILCDSKIMDAGYYEADELFKKGADYVTVLAVTDDATIIDSIKAARKAGGKVMVDMICIENIPKRVKELDEMGVDIIAVHTGVDQQALGRTPLDDLEEIRACNPKAAIAVAGGINRETINKYKEYNPNIIIVGGGIISAKDPVLEAEKLYHAISL